MRTFEQLPLLETERVYRNDWAAWEQHEALYSRPEYVWPLAEYFRRYLEDERAALLDGDQWVEPCVGGGAIVQGVERYFPRRMVARTGDIRDEPLAQWVADWTDERLPSPLADEIANAALVVTNPPFSRAVEIVEAAWRHCPHAIVAILQRATWYEPTKSDPRGPWLRKHNPDQVTIGRCEFFWPDGTSRGDGDSCSYTWYIWGRQKGRAPRQGPLGGHHELRPWWEVPSATLR